MTRLLRLSAAVLLAGLGTLGCTGGSETTAAVDEPSRETATPRPLVNARARIAAISDAIPLYPGALYRDDLTRRDEVMVRRRYGVGAKVYTLASDDSFPQVYHYYMTYLGQFRSFPLQDPWPSGQQNWRTLELPLNQVMQDPFIPGETLDPNGPQVLLQIAETEAEPPTVIRYIVTGPAAGAGAKPAAAAAAGSTAVASPVPNAGSLPAR